MTLLEIIRGSVQQSIDQGYTPKRLYLHRSAVEHTGAASVDGLPIMTMSPYAWSCAVEGICPYCRQGMAHSLQGARLAAFTCLDCLSVIVLDDSDPA